MKLKHFLIRKGWSLDGHIDEHSKRLLWSCPALMLCGVVIWCYDDINSTMIRAVLMTIAATLVALQHFIVDWSVKINILPR